MSAPAVTFTITSNNLGQTGTGGQENMLVVVGDSSTGTANQPYQSPVPNQFVNLFGYGQGPQLAALIAAQSGKSVGFVKAAAASVGTNTSVRPTSTNTSVCVVTLTGAPFDDYYGLVTVQTGGTVGVAGIVLTVSLDSSATVPPVGRTIYATVNLGTATTYVIPNTGLTLNFTSASLVAGDTYDWNSVAPAPSNATVACAIQSLIGQGFDIEDIIVPVVSNAAAVATYQTDCVGLFNAKIFQRLLTTARDVLYGGACTESEQTWQAALIADFNATAADHVGVCTGYYNCPSPIDGVSYRRPLLFQAAVTDSDVAISVDLAETALGPIAPLQNPIIQNAPDGYVYHNEAVNPGLDGARFISATTIPGLTGMYIVNPNLMAALGSDFNWLQHGHVIDKLCKILYTFFALELSSSVRVSKTTGFILPQDANALEARCDAEINAGLVNPGDVSDASIAITRNNNILATSQLLVTATIIPLAYLKEISITVGFKNPAIQVV